MTDRPHDGSAIPAEELRELFEKTYGALETLTLGGSLRAPEHAPTLPSARTLAAAAAAAEHGFDVGEEIGRGGMGIVYRSRQRCLDREVAVKRIHPTSDSDATRGQFVSEALVTAWLDHPNIVPVHDLTVDGGEVCLAMKLVGGRSWAEVLRARDTDPQWFERQLEVLLGVSNAVAFAHSKGIVHRDLKPENIMVGEFGEVLVMDWGIAIDVSEAPTNRTLHKSQVQGPSGTPLYMAPELACGRGEDQGPPTDVFLLGAMLYELITGRPPHRGDDLLQVLTAAAAGAPPEFEGDVPDELQAICRRAMARTPSDRYPDVGAFQSAVRGFLRHRESAAIADRAASALEECRHEKASPTMPERDRNRLYTRFAEAVAGYRQAQALWDGNHRARQGERDARLAYANAALEIGDFGLAETQIHPLSDGDPEAATLGQSIARARDRQSRARRTTRNLRWGLAGLAAVLLIGGTLAIVTIRQESARTAERAWTAKRNDARRFYERGVEAMEARSYEAAAAYFVRSLEAAPASEIPEGYASSWSEPAWPEESWIALRHASSQLGPPPPALPADRVVDAAAVAFGRGDPTLVAFLGRKGRYYLWDTKTGDVRAFDAAAAPGGTTPVWIQFDAANETLLSGHARDVLGRADSVRALDLASGAVATIFERQDPMIRGDATDPLRLLGRVPRDDSTDLLFETRDPHTLHRVEIATAPDGRPRPARTLACPLPEGTKIECAVADRVQSLLVVGASDGTITVLDTSAEPIRPRRTLVGHADGVTSLAINAQCDVVLSGSHDRTVRLWELETGRLLRQFEGHRAPISSVALYYTPEQRMAVSVSEDGEVLTWNLQPGVGPRKLSYADETTDGSRGPIAALAASPSGRFAVSGSEPARNATSTLVAAGLRDAMPPTVWDLERFEEVATGPPLGGRPVRFEFAADERSIFGQGGGACVEWDLASGAVRQTLPAQGAEVYPEMGFAIQFGPLRDDGVRVLGEAGAFTPFAGQDDVQGVCVSGDGSTALTRTPGDDVWIWRLPEVELLGKLACGPSFATALDERGRYALIAGRSGIVQLWDVAERTLLRQWSHGSGRVADLAFSPDGTLALLLTGTGERRVVIHDVRTGARLQRFEPAVLRHVNFYDSLSLATNRDATIQRAAFGGDGSFVLTHVGVYPVVWRLIGADVPAELPPDLSELSARIGLRVADDGSGLVPAK